MKKLLIVFVKAPLPGDVKTRFIPQLTSTESADLYKCFVQDTLQNVTRLNIKVIVAYQSKVKMADLSWLGLKNTPEFFKQEGKSLGERLIHSFGVAFGRGVQHVAIITSDSPTLPRTYIEQAFESLEQADVVLGPTADGGYYLVGLSRPGLKLFEEVSWSTDQIFESTAKNAARLGYSLRILPPHYDVDSLDDLQKLQEEMSKSSTHGALTTQRFLASLNASLTKIA